ncbi:type VII secretion protein EccCa [Virgisporangium aurantiacum]|uniref:Type VII secretion protein EccC n=1 Tax=Virgisporangium aurantiacum TaxID=175570 RepID=A0A8J4E1D2_9ACTN|nr:type VII secretion protein EccCa [Virgisporangium aurantiacum]GIJ55887.1 type VII secretion protein EccC [Virgisporangium aurantiacum]
MSTVLFRRPPRQTPPRMPRGELVLESPPDLAEPLPRSLAQLLMLLPMMAGGGAMALMYAGGGRGGVLTYLVGGLFAVSMLGMGATSIGHNTGHSRAETDARRREYMRYLGQSRRQVRRAAAQQRRALLWRHPEPATLWSLVASKRMWERRTGDEDFGEIRVAAGAQKLGIAIVPPQTRPVEDLEPLSAVALRRFVRAHSAVPDLPLAVQLRAFSRVVLRGERADVLALARATVAQLCTFHSPDDAQLVVVASAGRRADWDWVKWLPHAQDDRRADGAGARRRVYDSMAAFEEAAREDLEARTRHSPEAKPQAGAAHLMVVLDGGEDAPAGQLAGPGLLGVTVLDLSGMVPRDAGRWLLCLDVDADSVTADRGARRTRLGRPDRLTAQQALGLARALAPYRLSRHTEVQEATARITELPELLGLADATAVDPARTWRRRADRDRLRIPLGVSPDGSAVDLDFKEAALDGMGPHGLLIGATGSGKSELLRTMVLSLAITHSSEDLNFVLIDFKGGATFASLDVLPHTSAVITNLAEELAMVDRMEDALSGEMIRRQELLRAAGNYVSRHEYERDRLAGEPLAPLPSLLVICDEFSEMLAVKPDFIDMFVMIGRLGRSLGVHLLLASQRLEEGRLRGLDTHLSYRVGLRTFSAMESRVVLGVPDAYELPNAPGHGYLKVGTSPMQRFRAAYVSGPYRGAGGRTQRSTALVSTRIVPFGVDAVPIPEQPTVEPEQAPETESARQTTMLDVIVARLRDRGVPAHQVWLPPLAEAPGLDALLGDLDTDERHGLVATAWRKPGPLVVPVGIEDRPYEQSREPLPVELAGANGNVVVVGGPRSGKSTLLRTIIASLALTHSPREVQFMCIDFGGGALRALAGLPHVSGVAVRRDLESVRRSVAEVWALIEDREVRFAEAGVESIDSYRERRARGEFADDPFGDLFLVVDGYGLLREEQEELDSALSVMASRCLGFGVHLVLTASRWGEIRYNIRDYFTTRLELRLGDPSDSEINRRAAANVPDAAPGRGLSRNQLHFMSAVPRIDGGTGDEGLPEATAALVARVRAAWPHPPAPRVRLLPRQLPAAELWQAAAANAGKRIPLGYNEARLAPVYLDPVEDQHLVIFGDAQCGKTNLLRLIARWIVDNRTPAEAKLIIVDYRRSLLGAVEGEHLLDYVPGAQQAESMAAGIVAALNKRLPGPDVTIDQLRTRSWWAGPDLYLLVDDYDLVSSSSGNPLGELADLLPQARDIGLHLILARRTGGASRALYEPVLQRLKELDAPGLQMAGNPDEGALLGSVTPGPQPPGRGVLVRRSDGVGLIQTAFIETG